MRNFIAEPKAVWSCLILLCQVFFVCTSKLKCWNCHNAQSLTECHAKGKLEHCQSDQDVCTTVTRHIFGKTLIWKHCKQRKACENQRAQNAHYCVENSISSVCRCCCGESICNRNELCDTETAFGCPQWNTDGVKHGKVTCTIQNKVGSVCEASCIEEGYSPFPPENSASVCLQSGQWSRRKPCCALQCPPHVVADIVILAHRQSAETVRKREGTIIKDMLGMVETGPSRVRWAVLFYSGAIDWETSMTFDHPALQNSSTIRQAAKDGIPFRRTDDGLVNTGATLQYVSDNLLFPEHRESHNHIDVVLLIIEANSDDSIQRAARELHEKDVFIYVIFINFDRRHVDESQLSDLVGNNGKYFIVDGDELREKSETIANSMWQNICSHICSGSD